MISDKRAALIGDLATGSGGQADPVAATIVDSWPTKVTAPPLVFIVPPQGAAYVTGGPNFAQFTVSLDVVILVGRPDAADAVSHLDQLIEQVLANTMDWRLTGVDSPAIVTVGGVDYLGSVAHLSQAGTI